MSENTDKVSQWCKDAADELNVTSGIISTHKSYSGPVLNIVRAAAIIAAHAPALPGGVREAEVHTPDGLKVYDSPHGLMVLAHEHNAALTAPKTLPEGGAAHELLLECQQSFSELQCEEDRPESGYSETDALHSVHDECERMEEKIKVFLASAIPSPTKETK